MQQAGQAGAPRRDMPDALGRAAAAWAVCMFSIARRQGSVCPGCPAGRIAVD